MNELVNVCYVLYNFVGQVVAFNRTVSKVTDFLNNEAKGTNIIGATSMEDLVKKLKKPRRVMLLVKAGSAVDDFINALVCLFTYLIQQISQR